MSDADANANSPDADATTPDAPKPGISLRKVGLLSVLYFVQGLPFGFLVLTFPMYLRSEGMGIAKITFISVVNWPWLVKFIWAPLADRYFLPKIGRRRSWIIPAQLGLVVALLATGIMAADLTLWGLMAMLSVVNFFAATQDIGVDGLAVDILDDHERGIGNSAQAAAYKVGMIGGGAFLTYALKHFGLGLAGCFYAMAGAVAVAMLVPLLLKEAPVPSSVAEAQATPGVGLGNALRQTFTGEGLMRLLIATPIFTLLLWLLFFGGMEFLVNPPGTWQLQGGALARALPAGLCSAIIFVFILELSGSSDLFATLFNRQGALVFFGMVMLAKAGDSIANPLFRILLLDAGRTWDEINNSMNIGGMLATLVGSAICGYVIMKLGRKHALWLTILGQGLSHFGWVVLTLMAPHLVFGEGLASVRVGDPVSLNAVWVIALTEHFVSGMLTVVVFTLMMDSVRPEVGSGQYTLLMSFYGAVGLVLGMASGQIVEAGGYEVAFGAAGVITLLCLLLVPALAAGGYLDGHRPPAPTPAD